MNIYAYIHAQCKNTFVFAWFNAKDPYSFLFKSNKELLSRLKFGKNFVYFRLLNLFDCLTPN